MQTADKTRMGDLLVSKGLVSPEQVAQALELQRETGKRLGEVLVDQGLISRMDVASALGRLWKQNSTPQAAPQARGADPRRSRESELTLRAQLDQQDARVAELTEKIEELEAALADRDQRLELILTFLQAPSAR